MDDEVAVSTIQETGSEEAFRLLVQRYRERVLRLASSVLGTRFSAEAEDVVQEVFLRVHRKLAQFRGDSAFSSWLYRIAYNTAIDRRRELTRRRWLIAEDPPAGSRDGSASEPFARPPGLDGERRRELLACVERLPDPYRTAIFLHYWHGCSAAEIGELLGARANTVKTYLFRGRKRLARILQPGADR